jgi:DNA polymerase zeta
MDLFRVRLNCIDHYQGVPSRFDPKLRRDVSPSEINNEPKVPVIRVFGTTETGQKVCAHIHGAFPYLYIDYNGRVTPDEGKFSAALKKAWLKSYCETSRCLHP